MSTGNASQWSTAGDNEPAGSFPLNLYDFAWFEPGFDPFKQLVDVAEPEEWNYTRVHENQIPQDNTGIDETEHPSRQTYPILFRYIRGTFRQVAKQGKIAFADDQYGNPHCCFDTGLVTSDQEPIYAFFDRNNRGSPEWYFRAWIRHGESRMTMFAHPPDMAHYIDDPSRLIFDATRELRPNYDHIINHWC